MTQLSSQMQGKMNQSLKTARIDTMIQNAKGAMIDAANRIEKRPSLKGCVALKKTQSHNLIKSNKDDSSFQMMQMAISGGGVAEIAADVAVDTYANRKATQMRPQDSVKLTPKQEAKIRDDNMNDMKLFFSVAEQLETLEFLKQNSGHEMSADLHAVIDTKNNEIVGVKFEQHSMTPKYNPHMTPEQLQKFEAKNAKDRIDFKQTGITKKHDISLSPSEIEAIERSALQFASTPKLSMRA